MQEQPGGQVGSPRGSTTTVSTGGCSARCATAAATTAAAALNPPVPASSAARPLSKQHPSAIPEDTEVSIGDSPSLPPELAADLALFLEPLEEPESPTSRGGLSLNEFGRSDSRRTLPSAVRLGSGGSASSGSANLGSGWAAAAASAAATAAAGPGSGGPPAAAPAVARMTCASLPPVSALPPLPRQGSPPAKEGRLRRIFQMRTAGPAFLAEQLRAQESLGPLPLGGGKAGGRRGPGLQHAQTESPANLRSMYAAG